MVDTLRAATAVLPECREERAWVGTRWRVGQATIAHLFGGEDGLFRITLRGDPDDVAAFSHLRPPYFKSDWGSKVIGMMLDEATDWGEVAEMVTISYCIQAPRHLADRVDPPTI